MLFTLKGKFTKSPYNKPTRSNKPLRQFSNSLGLQEVSPSLLATIVGDLATSLPTGRKKKRDCSNKPHTNNFTNNFTSKDTLCLFLAIADYAHITESWCFCDTVSRISSEISKSFRPPKPSGWATTLPTVQLALVQYCCVFLQGNPSSSRTHFTRLPPLNSTIPFREGCTFRKQHKTLFPDGLVTRTAEPLALVHTDPCGPMNAPSFGRALHFLLFVDDYSRFMYVCFF